MNGVNFIDMGFDTVYSATSSNAAKNFSKT